MCHRLHRPASQTIVFVVLIISTAFIYSIKTNSNVRSIINGAQYVKIKPPIYVQKLRSLNNTLFSLMSNAEFFKTYNETFVNNQTSNGRDICDVYDEDAKHRRFFVPSVWKEYVSVESDDITLVTQLSFNRFYLIDLLIKHWSGPLSITIYVNTEQLQVLGGALATHPTLLERENIDFHIVMESGVFYPVNFLRQLAFENSYTLYVFLSDADFVCRSNAYRIIKGHLKKHSLREKQVLVIPAFEFADEKTHYVPRNETMAKYFVSKEKLIAFHSLTYFPGHGSTNTTKWLEATEPYYVSWNRGYEPYIVGIKDDLPSYNTAFVGRYMDKISHLLHVHAMGFKFLVLPDVFIIHIPHEKFSGAQYLRCAHNAYDDFLKELAEKYPQRITTQITTQNEKNKINK